jgi:hypothetical protein
MINEFFASFVSFKKFEILLKAIEPEQRVRFLTLEEGEGDQAGPFIHTIQLARENSGWDTIVSVLSQEHLMALVRSKDARGDSLLVYQARNHGAAAMLKTLFVLDFAQRKAYLSEMCPHGLNAVAHLFIGYVFNNAKKIFPILPKSDWQDILAIKPEGWRMTIGEKIVVTLYAQKNIYEQELATLLRRGRRAIYAKEKKKMNDDAIEYFAQNYAIQLPKIYRDLDPKDLDYILNDIHQVSVKNGCVQKANFQASYQHNPEDILGLEPYLPSKDYTQAYRQLIRRHHPDKNPGQGTEQACLINAANEFMSSEDNRKHYMSPTD